MIPLPTGAIVGILGGGQLGRMLAIAAAQLGYRVAIYAPDQAAVAAEVAAFHVAAGWDDERALREFAQDCDVVTFEWENVPLSAVDIVAAHGRVVPSRRSLEVAQDRLMEKAFATRHGLKVPDFVEVTDSASLDVAATQVGAPAILKTVRDGYDGKGQSRVKDIADAAAAWTAIGQQRGVWERLIEFFGEFSVIVVRAADGAVAHWEVTENIHSAGILAESRVPAPLAWQDQISLALKQTELLAAAVNHVGVLTAEFFATEAGPIFNEMAPRVHNSGHWTIEGAVTSQFENHIRAICGLPLGDTATRSTPVLMRNLIGDEANDWAALLGDPACKLHLYGKREPHPGRKMGHATWVGSAPA